MPPLIQSWLLQSVVIFLLFGSLAGVLAGVLLVFRPQSFQRLGARLNRWISTRHLDTLLERNIAIDPWFYRHRIVSGALILSGAVYVLVFFIVTLDREPAIAGLAARLDYPPALVGGLLDAVVLSALLGALCAVLAALFMLFRPSLLRGFEQDANRWLSLRKALKPMEVPRDTLDRFVLRHARQTGVFLMLGGLYTLVFLLLWLGRQPV